MIMDPMALAARDELDRDILAYVRACQKMAPVTHESVTNFEQGMRRRRVTSADVQDRLDYLTAAKYLQTVTEWQAGSEFTHYRITADGVDFLDGKAPPRGWKSGG